ncbi:MAG: hypothetical protein KAI24_19585 [Planctomycetes bacterium]|nr:hypothetical protein [Planctomycetota bacterium]
MTAHRHRLHRLLPLALLFAGCVGSPRDDESGPRFSAQRLLALDFGTRTSARRLDRLTTLPAAFVEELQRGNGVADELRPLHDDVRRVSLLPGKLLEGFAFEARRHPLRLDLLLPSRFEFEQDVADDLANGLFLLGPSLHPLGEISDREHRTRHDDDRPERTLLERLRRRLRL